MRVNPSDLTDDELIAAIDQMEAEAAMPGPDPSGLNEARREADNRNLFY